jgi:hypothetical protein
MILPIKTIMSVLNISTYIFAVIRLAVILVIMFVSTFKTVVTLFISSID